MRQEKQENVTAKCGTRKRPLAAGQHRSNIFVVKAGPHAGGNAFFLQAGDRRKATMRVQWAFAAQAAAGTAAAGPRRPREDEPQLPL